MRLEPASGLFGVGTGIDRFTAEVDAAGDKVAAAAQTAGNVGFGYRGIGPGDEQAPGFALAQHVDPMFKPPAAASQHDRRIGRTRICRRRPAEREGEEDEAEGVDQGN